MKIIQQSRRSGGGGKQKEDREYKLNKKNSIILGEGQTYLTKGKQHKSMHFFFAKQRHAIKILKKKKLNETSCTLICNSMWCGEGGGLF